MRQRTPPGRRVRRDRDSGFWPDDREQKSGCWKWLLSIGVLGIIIAAYLGGYVSDPRTNNWGGPPDNGDQPDVADVAPDRADLSKAGSQVPDPTPRLEPLAATRPTEKTTSTPSRVVRLDRAPETVSDCRFLEKPMEESDRHLLLGNLRVPERLDGRLGVSLEVEDPNLGPFRSNMFAMRSGTRIPVPATNSIAHADLVVVHCTDDGEVIPFGRYALSRQEIDATTFFVQKLRRPGLPPMPVRLKVTWQ